MKLIHVLHFIWIIYQENVIEFRIKISELFYLHNYLHNKPNKSGVKGPDFFSAAFVTNEVLKHRLSSLFDTSSQSLLFWSLHWPLSTTISALRLFK